MIQVDRRALEDAGVSLLVEFGSRRAGSARPGSDYDLAVLFVPNGDAFERLDAVRTGVRTDPGVELDLVVLNDAEPLLLHEVATQGAPVFEARPGVFEEFRIYAVKRYFDTAWIRRIEADALRARYG